MDNKGIEKYKPRNPLTHAKHRREVFWQITIPILIGVILLVAFAVFIAFISMGDKITADKMASISLIWLIIPAMVASLVIAVILAGFVYLMLKLIEVLPPAAFKLNNLVDKLRIYTQKYADMIVKPVLVVKSGWASVRAAFGKGPVS